MRLTPPLEQRLAPTAAHYGWAAVGLFALTVYGGLLPFHFTPMSFAEAAASFRKATVWDTADLAARGDWVVSAVQYALLSYVLMAAVCTDRRRWIGLPIGLLVAGGCAALAVGIEFLQVYFPPRTVSVNDIVVESSGAILGTAAWLAVGRRVTAWARRLEGVTGLAGLARRLLPAYVVLLLVVQLMPFDFVFGRNELSARVSSNNIRLVPFADDVDAATIGKAALCFAAFLPLGLLSAMERGQSGRSGGWADIGPVLLAPVAITAGKIFVYSRTFDASDIVTGMAGILAGWRLGGRAKAQSLAAWATAPRLGIAGAALWLAWVGAVAYLNWQPFDFTVDPARFATDAKHLPSVGMRHMALAPFVDYYWGDKYHALDLFMVKALSFIPAGILLALGSRTIYRRGSGWSAAAFAALLAIGVEVGRYFLPAHLPSVTDVFIQTAGAWVGYRMTQFVRATLWAEAALYGWLRTPNEPLHFITADPDTTPEPVIIPLRRAQ